MNYLNFYREKIEDGGKEGKKIHVFKMILLQDEASNPAKESKCGKSANTWEFLSACFDGNISPIDTLRGKDQRYSPIWHHSTSNPIDDHPLLVILANNLTLSENRYIDSISS